MSHYQLKIRDKFISDIELGQKKHEYRLATPERMAINIGEILTLISNTDKTHFVNVQVTAKEKFATWDEALSQYWYDDFHNLFSSIQEAKKECYRFYTKEEVDRYGIVVFSILPHTLQLSKSRVLLDTNIIIQRESHNNASFEVAEMYKWFDKLNISKVIDEVEIAEIEKYKDDDIVKNMLTKLTSYNKISPDTKEDDFFTEIADLHKKDENGLIDNHLLLQVYNQKVDLLITDDRLMLNKAKELYIRDSVLSVAEVLSLFESEYPSNIDYPVLSVKLVKIDSLDIYDSFFDTLREDYDGIKFNNWFEKKKDEYAYIYRDEENQLQGFLYLKIEEKNEDGYKEISPPLSKKKRLKIGTFKVNSTGIRVGERFLKIVFDNAIRNKVDEVYVTLFEDKRDEVRRLEKLMFDWGFKFWGTKENGEVVLVKSLEHYSTFESPKLNYPLINPKARYWFLPIVARFHSNLFPDSAVSNENTSIYYNHACSYAIEKIYVTRANHVAANPGDVLIIYRMSDYNKKYRSVATGKAVLQEVIYPRTETEYLEICNNKSVFSKQELEYYYRNGYKTVVKLLYLNAFNNKINNYTLGLNNLLPEGGPRLNNELTKQQYIEIIRIGEDEND